MISKELQTKIDDLFKHTRILGEYIFTDDEYQEIKSETKLAIRNTLQTRDIYYAIRVEKIIFITLVELAKRWQSKIVDDNDDDDDSGFWNYIYNELEIDLISDGGFEARVFEILRQIVKRLAPTVGRAYNKKWYYGTLLMHGLAPQKSLYALFDLAYNIYKNDFMFEYSVDDA